MSPAAGNTSSGWVYQVCLGVGISRELEWVCQWVGYVQGMGMSRGSGYVHRVGQSRYVQWVGMSRGGYVTGVGPDVGMSRESAYFPGGWVCSRGMGMSLTCHLSHDACDVTCIHTCEKTYAGENITFPQVLLWVIRTW